jgi:hypothetical protein
MKITQQEFIWLIKESDRDHAVQSKFGPGWVALLDVPSNDWAKRRIEEIRAAANGI